GGGKQPATTEFKARFVVPRGHGRKVLRNYCPARLYHMPSSVMKSRRAIRSPRRRAAGMLLEFSCQVP
ncbi:MAG TPA: hypothetical protein VM822_23340, partial [Pseudolabrys sp.]|nr:hypothetical protein [Pseudolabrys sp.]